MKKINLIPSILIQILLLIILNQCAGFIDIKTSDIDEWIEKKAFPIVISFFNDDKIDDVTLYYSVNNKEAKSVNLDKKGKEYYYTIPGSEMIAGEFKYYVMYMFKDKEKTSKTYNVHVLTIEEARKKFEKKLYRRISFNPPKETPVNRDLTLILNVSKSTPTTEVTIHYKKPDQNTYKSKKLINNNDNFTAVIKKEELKQGYDTYYFTINEMNEDVGILEVFYPFEGSNNPLTYKILSLEELKEIMKKELYSCINHKVPEDVYVINDLDLNLAVNYSQSMYIKEFSENKLNAVIYYTKKNNDAVFKKASMKKTDNNKFIYKITSKELFEGYDRYFFKISDYTEDAGLVEIEYPLNGQENPLQYNILDAEEVKKILENDLYERIKHTEVKEAKEGSDLLIIFSVNKMKNDTKGIVFYNKENDDSYKKVEAYLDKNNRFIAKIPKEDIRLGYDQYFIRIKEPNSYFEYIIVVLPKSGAKSPYQYNIIKLKDLIYNGIDFEELKDIESGTPVNVKIKLNFLLDDTKVFLKYRLSDDTMEYHTLPMNQDGKIFNIGMSQALLQPGRRIDYYFEIRVKSENINITYPKKEILPLYFYIKKEPSSNQDENNVFGDTNQTHDNMLIGRIYKIEENTEKLPDNLNKDYEALNTKLYTRKIDISKRDFTEGFPGVKNIIEWFAIQYKGSIVIKKEGEYKFKIISDDGAKLYINGKLVVDNDGIHKSKAANGKIYLKEGTYKIRLDYFQGPRYEIALQLFVHEPNEGEKIFDLKNFE